MSLVSPDELRHIAHLAQVIVPVDGLPGPEKNLWNEKEHRLIWEALVGATHIANLDPGMMIFRHDTTVELSWGGALVGHWGVIIDTGAEQRDGDIDKGIVTFIGAD